MDFITIDFETANSSRNSPCEIGLTFVHEGKIKKTHSWLIKPYGNQFDDFNISIHGITPADVADKPEFHELWPEINELIENKFLIAHNAGFDFSVLRKTLELYNLPFPSLNYSCSYIFSKRTWISLPAYDLKTLCSLNGIELMHHRAGGDSLATAKLALEIFRINEISNIDEISSKLNIKIGRLFTEGYSPSETIQYKKPFQLTDNNGNKDIYNLFYGKTVVFTGSLTSIARREAAQLIHDKGGIFSENLNSETDFLIVGHQDFRVVGEDGMSSKQEKAMKLISKGSGLEIMSEVEFLKNI